MKLMEELKEEKHQKEKKNKLKSQVCSVAILSKAPLLKTPHLTVRNVSSDLGKRGENQMGQPLDVFC